MQLRTDNINVAQNTLEVNNLAFEFRTKTSAVPGGTAGYLSRECRL